MSKKPKKEKGLLERSMPNLSIYDALEDKFVPSSLKSMHNYNPRKIVYSTELT